MQVRLGAALTGGLTGLAFGLVCLLGAVLLSTAPIPAKDPALSWRDAPAPQRATPVRERERESPDKTRPAREPKPPVRLWHGPSFERQPPRPRKALA